MIWLLVKWLIVKEKMPSHTHPFHACIILWQISSEHKEFLLRERTWKNTGTRAKASTGGLSTRGRAYLKFELQSKIKVDKTFVHCHRRKEKHKWIRAALYLFYMLSCEKKIFLAKASLLNLSPEGHCCSVESLQDFTLVFQKEKVLSMICFIIFFWIIPGIGHKILWLASVPDWVLEIKLSN